MMEKDRGTYDVVIIGAGPAGISAGIWCVELGLSHVVLERSDRIGGQLNWTYNRISNYPGIAASGGQDMLKRFSAHAEAMGVQFQNSADVASVDVNERIIELSDGRRFDFGYAVIASGVRRRSLGVPGEDEFYGRGIMSSGAKELESVAGKRVVIVGGGDAAFENAVMISRSAANVVLVHRGDTFRARREFVEAATKSENVELIVNTSVIRFIGTDKLTSVEVENVKSGAATVIPADLALIRIGVAPNSELVVGLVETDDHGFIIADRAGRTNVEWLYAVGDVADRDQMTLANASYSASAAIRGIRERLDRSHGIGAAISGE